MFGVGRKEVSLRPNVEHIRPQARYSDWVELGVEALRVSERGNNIFIVVLWKDHLPINVDVLKK